MNAIAYMDNARLAPPSPVEAWSEAGFGPGKRCGSFGGWMRALREKIAREMDEIWRMSRLRRYIAPQIAEAILRGEGGLLFKSHRREITVVFLDLRGFTAFTESAEPEDVLEMLKIYHAEMGRLIVESDGTLERFAGDGIMVFFNDPVAYEDHIERAVAMTLKMRDRMKELCAGWRKKGWELDLGVGLAAGYAALGNIGFAGRMDYSAVGNVTNLASRLCDEAKGGQILTNQKTLGAIERRAEAQANGGAHPQGVAPPRQPFSITPL